MPYASHLNNISFEELQARPERELKTWLDDAAEKISQQDYVVYTDEEAEKARDESIDDYLDIVVFSKIPTDLHFYFDDDLFKKHCRLNSRRGNELASYDGMEHEETVNNETFFIYRRN